MPQNDAHAEPNAPRWRKLYPFASHAITVDGHRYHYLDEGAGELLLLVHGNPTWSFYWRNVVQALRPNYRLIVPDHLGCGLSDKPRQTYRLADRIDHLGQLVQQLELQNITLLAHDWGGAIGLGLATEMPERFSRFALLNTAAFRSGWMPKRIRVCRAPVLGKIAVQGLNGFARSALWMAMHDPRRLSREAREGLLAPYDSWRNRRAIYDFVQDIPLSDKHPSYATLERIETRLALLKDKPWMFVWGMRDWCFKPQFLERFLDFIPRAEVHRLEDAGHYVLEDAPDEVINHLRNFLHKNP